MNPEFNCSRVVTLYFAESKYQGLLLRTLTFVVPHTPPLRLSLHSQHPSSPWVCPLNPEFQHPASPRTSRCVSQAGTKMVVAQTVYVELSLFCLPQTTCCTLLSASEAPFWSQLISPLARELARVQEPFLFFSSLPGETAEMCLRGGGALVLYVSAQKEFRERQSDR